MAAQQDSMLLRSVLPAVLLHRLQQPDPEPAVIVEACALLDAEVQALAPFVPALVLDTAPTWNTPPSFLVNGSVVLVDLSGFNALSSALALEGRYGAEQAGTIINQVFGALQSAIDAHGGQVLKFDGDGLTVLFDALHYGAAHALYACAAALDMQACMSDFVSIQTGHGVFALNLRIVIHSGRVYSALVGDATHTELLITGRTINNAVVALESAGPGETLISDETRRLLPTARVEARLSGLHRLVHLDQPPAAPKRHPFSLPALPPGPGRLDMLLATVRALRPFVPNDLPSRFLRGNAEQGEFRPVTVLFASFYTFSRMLALLELPATLEQDSAIVSKVVNAYYAATKDVIYRYGGTINKMDMATFGNRLMALFGAPLAHEDDPLQAVQAAMSLRAAYAEANERIGAMLHDWVDAHPEHRALLRVLNTRFQQRVGLASGTVFAGIIGTPQRREYTVMGDTIQLAARLMTAARDGDVLLAASTQRLVGSMLETSSLPPMILKGLDRPVPVSRAQRLRDAATAAQLRRPTALFGRQTELATLRSLAEQALGGEGRVAALTGESGIGKTRLLGAVQEMLPALRPEVLVVAETALAYEQTQPYALVSRLLRRCIAVLWPEPLSAETLLPLLERHIPEWSRFAPLLGPLLDLPLPETELTGALDVEQRRDRLHEVIVQVILATAKTGALALLIDDIHVADASSGAVIDLLASEADEYPLLLVLAYELQAAFETPWVGLPHITTLPLGDLTIDETRQMVAALLGTDMGAPFQRFLERTRGKPFFVEEMIHYLVDTGLLRRDANERWHLIRSITPGDVPVSVQQLIVAHLDQLPEEARRIAHVAAVLGQRFDARLLAATMAPEQVAPTGLVALINAGMIQPASDTNSYRFKHALVRDVVYESMLFGRRRELHAAAAAALEEGRALPQRPSERQAALAQHYLAAGMPEQAHPYIVATARHAQSRYAYIEAITLFRQAVSTAPWHDTPGPADLPAAADLYQQLGDLLLVTGDGTSARETFLWLLAVLDSSKDEQFTVLRAAIERKIGRTFEQQSNLDMALRWCLQAATTIATAPLGDANLLEQAHVLSDRGWLHFRREEFTLARQYLEEALQHLRFLNAEAEQARVLNRLGGVAWASGDTGQAQSYVERSLHAARASGDLLEQGNALSNLAALTSSVGDNGQALRYALEALELNQRFANRRACMSALVTAGCACEETERYDEAIGYFGQALRYATDLRDQYHLVLVLLNMADLYLTTGDTVAARHSLDMVQTNRSAAYMPGWEVEYLLIRAELALQEGSSERAAALISQAEAVVDETISEERALVERMHARLLQVAGRHAEALETLERSKTLFEELGMIAEAQRTQRQINRYDAKASVYSRV